MHTLALQLAPTASVQLDTSGLTVSNFRQSLHFAPDRPECAEVLDALKASPQRMEALLVPGGMARAALGAATVYFVLDRLDRIGAISRALVVDGSVKALLHPNCGFSSAAVTLEPLARYQLSRFACLQPERGIGRAHWLVSSPLGHARLALFDPSWVSGIAALVEGLAVPDFAARCGVAPEIAATLLQLLVWCGAAAPLTAEGELAEDRSQALRHWEPQDLLFHSRSRMGRHSGAFGGTFHMKGAEPELPAVPPAREAATIVLPRPDLARLVGTDPSLCAVMEARRSERAFGSAPLTYAQLGELLYRAARLKEVRRRDGLEIAFYPYPGGGARSELCIYLAVSEGQELAAGMYRYDAQAHALAPVAGLTPEVGNLLHDARSTLGGSAAPPVLLVFSARFQRVSWKYQSMAYAVILKNVGALMQTLYLNATAMGLGACALGGGNADLFARCIGTDYYEETSVGEFALGTTACS